MSKKSNKSAGTVAKTNPAVAAVVAAKPELANVTAVPLSAVTVATPAADSTKTVDVATPTTPTAIVPSVKQKVPQITEGCMVGRMSLLRKCVTEKRTYDEALTIVREKYPFGLTGRNALKWITKHFDRIAKKLAPAAPAIATPTPQPDPIKSATALIAAAAIVAETPAPTKKRTRKTA